jgi:hypothetical protein
MQIWITDAVRPVVERILNNMQLVLQDTRTLKEKYGLRQDDRHWRESFAQFRQRLSRTQQGIGVAAKTKWAVGKKDKFKA